MHKTLKPLSGLASLFLLLSLPGCSSPAIVKPQRVEIRVPVYVAIPAALTEPVQIPMLPKGAVVNDDLADLVERRGAAIRAANDQLAKIRALQPK